MPFFQKQKSLNWHHVCTLSILTFSKFLLLTVISCEDRNVASKIIAQNFPHEFGKQMQRNSTSSSTWNRTLSILVAWTCSPCAFAGFWTLIWQVALQGMDRGLNAFPTKTWAQHVIQLFTFCSLVNIKKMNLENLRLHCTHQN